MTKSSCVVPSNHGRIRLHTVVIFMPIAPLMSLKIHWFSFFLHYDTFPHVFNSAVLQNGHVSMHICTLLYMLILNMLSEVPWPTLCKLPFSACSSKINWNGIGESFFWYFPVKLLRLWNSIWPIPVYTFTMLCTSAPTPWPFCYSVKAGALLFVFITIVSILVPGCW